MSCSVQSSTAESPAVTPPEIAGSREGRGERGRGRERGEGEGGRTREGGRESSHFSLSWSSKVIHATSCERKVTLGMRLAVFH